MAEAVLDSTAVLALLRNEPGADRISRVIARSLLCSVNLTEVIGKLIERGAPAPAALEIARGLPYRIVPFDEDSPPRPACSGARPARPGSRSATAPALRLHVDSGCRR